MCICMYMHVVYIYTHTHTHTHTYILCVWHVSACSVVSNCLWPHGLWPTRFLHPLNFPGKNTGGGCHFLLQRIFLTQGSNSCLLRYRQILYCWATWEAPMYILYACIYFMYVYIFNGASQVALVVRTRLQCWRPKRHSSISGLERPPRAGRDNPL